MSATATSVLDDLEQRYRSQVDAGNAIIEKYPDGQITDTEDRKALRAAAEEANKLKEQIAEAQGDHQALEAMRAAKAEVEAKKEQARKATVERNRPSIYGGAGTPEPGEPLTLGEALADSDAYRSWMQKFPQGGPTNEATVYAEAVAVPRMRQMLGLWSPTEKARARAMRAIIAGVEGGAAAGLAAPDWRGLLEPGMTRPLTIRQLVTVIPTQAEAVDFVRETSRDQAAAPVPEASATTGTSGTKAEGGLQFDPARDIVRTIAVWVAATKKIVADVPALRAYVDQYLEEDVGIELEDQMIDGDGTGENLAGILNDPNIGTAGPPGAGASALDAIRTAKRKVFTDGRTRATAVVLNPEDSEAIDLLKRNDEVNNFAGSGPFAYTENQPLWGLPRVESEAVPQGTALVGDFRRAILWLREDTTISVGTAGDDFIRNIVRLLAEMRAAFTVVRPKAFVAVDLA